MTLGSAGNTVPNTLRGMTRYLHGQLLTTGYFTDANIDALLNNSYHIVSREAVMAQDQWDFSGEILTGSLVANQREYVFPAITSTNPLPIWEIRRVDVSYDNATTWRKAEPFDISERSLPIATDTNSSTSDFSQSNPFYDLYDNSLFLYPTPTSASTNGLRIHAILDITELSATSDAPKIDTPFHPILCFWAAMMIAIAIGDSDLKQSLLNDYNERLLDLKEHYGMRARDTNMSLKPLIPSYR